MIGRKKIKNSLASYKNKKGQSICDLEELATILSKVNQVPERLGFTKACEVALLAQYALRAIKSFNRDEE